ncbi:MAG: hypothetical protein RJA70_294 [Pseudomonadota bacterium]|jgi:uncharacterized membrane protein YvlD (DUF360 family)
MQALLVTWALYSLAFALASALIPGVKLTGGFMGLVRVAALFGLLNWALAWLLSAVFIVVTLGLAWLFSIVTHTVVTAVLLKLTDALSDSLEVKSFWSALLAAIVMSLTVAAARNLILPLFGLAT